jgi:acetamidase/formamidase
MSVHVIAPCWSTVHGYFDRKLSPIITVTSGDTIVCQTIDGSWGEAGRTLFGLECIIERKQDDGHPLVGPIFVQGAMPGDVLEVHLGTVRPGSWGWTAAGPRPGRLRYGYSADREVLIGWRIDWGHRVARDTNNLDITLPISPFLGIIGTAPASAGPHETRFPRPVGGNMDCCELVSGSTIWLPVEVEGGLLSVGDGHALQADGETSSTALECPMDEVILTVRVRKDIKIESPHAMTPSGYVVIGVGADLDSAAEMAINGTLSYLQLTIGIQRAEAVAIASLVANLRVTQIANGTVGVHALIKRHVLSALRR